MPDSGDYWKTLLVTAIGSLILLFPALAYADSAQWNLNPTSGDGIRLTIGRQ